MHFFSGFSLSSEQHFFLPWLKTNDYTVAGFSYGAVKAFERVLASSERIDTLQLFSPAFFLDKPEGFKRVQVKGFQKDSTAYRARFLAGCFSPYAAQTVDGGADTVDDLKTLLYFDWPVSGLRRVVERGVRIEVYLGEKDAIINPEAAKEYFLPYATTYTIKGANHFLQGE